MMIKEEEEEVDDPTGSSTINWGKPVNGIGGEPNRFDYLP